MLAGGSVPLPGARPASPEAARIVAGMVRELGGREEATVLGLGFRCNAPDVALVNGTAAHALDYDDVTTPMRGHPSVPLMPAALALADGT